MGVLALVAISLFAVLGGRLYFLQVMQPEEFEELVAGNRVREIYTEAPRGQILDSKGRVLAGRRESLVVTLDWTALREAGSDARADVFAAVAEELSSAGIKTKASRLESIYTRSVDGELKPVVVADDVDEEVWVRLAEADLVGIDVERQWVRTYPYGSVAAHLIGYTGSVRDAERAAELNASSDKTYFAGDELGIAGLERVYEAQLRGTPELRRVEVNAQNQVVRTLEIVQEAVPGDDLVLSLDIDLQYAAEQILEDELIAARGREQSDNSRPHVADSGALVALDVTDGSIVALASFPTFDPRDFIFGISSDLWNELSQRSDVPLLDRSVRGAYPAGSTFKPFVAYSAMEAGVRDQFFTWIDEGVYILESCIDPDDRGAGCRKQNAGGIALGSVQMREALERSSDTYFYSLGETFWVQQDTYGRVAMQDTAERFGFGSSPGIDLPSQTSGRVPTPENRIEEFGEDARWFPGDNVNLAIGQGDLLMSPLQLTNAYAMLATGGTQYEPHLVAASIDPDGVVTPFEPVIVADDPLDPAILEPIHEGLLAVVNPGLGTGRGTGVNAFRGFPLANYPIAGKTGTAQVRNKADFALFSAYGPMPDPQYAVSAVLEQAGFGGDAAAPAVRRFFDLLAGTVPIPEAPVAEERVIDVGGIRTFDLTADELFLPDGDLDLPAIVPDEAPGEQSPAPPPTAAPTTAAPSTTTTATTEPSSTTESGGETTSSDPPDDGTSSSSTEPPPVDPPPDSSSTTTPSTSTTADPATSDTSTAETTGDSDGNGNSNSSGGSP